MMKMLLFSFSLLLFNYKISLKELNLFFLFMTMIMIIILYSGSMSLGFNTSVTSWSWWLLLLSSWIISMSYLSMNNILENKEEENLLFKILLILYLCLMMTFISIHLLAFYFWFESILLPMIILMINWGYHMERFPAFNYLLLYTIMGSLPLMTGLLWFYSSTGTFIFMEGISQPKSFYWWIYIMAFLIKLPLFTLHFWLPKAHVEAPAAGSMILAGVLLKLGGYGLYRVLLWINLKPGAILLLSMSIFGGIWASWACFRQTDIKALIAYSSVGHMGLFLSSLLTTSEISYHGGLMLMLGHGLCSSGLFFWISALYERLNTRSIILLKSMLYTLPSFSFWGFLLISSNMSAPPSLNLWAELSLMISLIKFSYMLIFPMLILFLLTGMYNILLYSSLNHNQYWIHLSFQNMTLRENLTFFLHWVPLNLLFLVSDSM